MDLLDHSLRTIGKVYWYVCLCVVLVTWNVIQKRFLSRMQGHFTIGVYFIVAVLLPVV